MKTIKIFENYGCLAAEKRSIYTAENPAATATAWDEMTVAVPDGWDAWENNYGEAMVTAPWGMNYTVNQVLCGEKKPMFMAIDEYGDKHGVTLRIIEIHN